jgi:hypothetical protein
MRKPLKKTTVAARLEARLFEANQEIDELRNEITKHRRNEAAFARDKARRADQFRALLQATNLILAVAAGGLIDMEKLND